MVTETDKLVLEFFLGLARSQPEDLSIDDILRFTEKKVEKCHCFIQWIFPMMEPSQHNSSAPQISGGFKELFLENTKAQESFCKSCRKYLNFIGFECVLGEISILTTENAKMFYDRQNHNRLRITRVLNSLNQIGKTECSKNIFSKLKRIYSENPCRIPKDSFEYWAKTQRL